MNRKQVIEYYKKYTNNRLTNEMAIAFTNMLMQKATWSLRTGNKINMNGVMRTGKVAEQIYCLAEDIFCDSPELRGY